jgi:acyl-CoA synthetase (NDP forming)
MGTIQLIRIITTGYKGKIFPIHLRLDNVLGYKAYKSIAEVPEIPDLVIIVLPPKVVPQVFKECGEKGVKKIVLISGGFREVTGDRANTLTEEIIEIANCYGIRFIGPNCFGFYNSWLYPENDGIFNMMVWGDGLKRGKFSLASQSGTMSSHWGMDPEYIDLPVGKTISVGNEANIDIVDFLEYFKDDEETNVIGLYIEEIKRGQRFIQLTKEITAKKPIIAIYGGGSGAGNRAIKSHTGSMAGNIKIFDAMIKETGIIKTDYVEEFLDIASILAKPNFIYPKGNRIGIITNSGGPGALIANNAERKKLIVPELKN